MSKELEALQKLRDLVECLTRIDFSQIEEALKRIEPMKPNYGGKFPQCPVCKRLLHSILQKQCDNCAQVIDWGGRTS